MPEAPDRPLPGGLEINADRVPDRVVLSLTGELDLASAPSFERAFQEAAESNPAHLVIDLGGLSFMDSTGLRALLLARQHAQDSGQRLSLRPGPRQVQRVFELSGTADSFSFEDEGV